MLGPNVLARTEYLQSALVRGGLSGLRLAVTTRMLANSVIGAALTEATWRQAAHHGTQTEARWSDDDLFERGLDGILAVAVTGSPDRAAG
jgi:hypothetical protein